MFGMAHCLVDRDWPSHRMQSAQFSTGYSGRVASAERQRAMTKPVLRATLETPVRLASRWVTTCRAGAVYVLPLLLFVGGAFAAEAAPSAGAMLQPSAPIPLIYD